MTTTPGAEPHPAPERPTGPPLPRPDVPWRRDRSSEPAAPHQTPAITAVPPEARPFQGRRAGLVTRLVANTVDFVVVVGVVLAGWLGFAALRFMWDSRSFSFPVPPFAVLLAAGGAVAVVYLTGAWGLTGRSYGDHLLGLRVVNWRGRRMRLGGSLLRALFCVFFPIGLFWVIVSRQNRSVQDVVLRTSVIYDWASHEP